MCSKLHASFRAARVGLVALHHYTARSLNSLNAEALSNSQEERGSSTSRTDAVGEHEAEMLRSRLQIPLSTATLRLIVDSGRVEHQSSVDAPDNVKRAHTSTSC